ncbi:MAG: hypothetical protein C4523_02940 [Myxococcales bacterium]|nr:MAG: hypothetical protein C4523_02940 [Myxococcales bacterium]
MNLFDDERIEGVRRRRADNVNAASGGLLRAVGAAFAKYLTWPWLAAMAVCLGACVVPQDIRERPPADTDAGEEEEYEYWPVITNPNPAPGLVKVPAEVDSFPFIINSLLPPDENDSLRRNDLEIRWFLDFESNPTILRTDTLDSEQIYRLDPNVLDPPDDLHILEVIVSDLGFVGGDDPKETPPNAHTYTVVWAIQIQSIEAP